MAFLFWDASALAKRYFAEAGNATVNALFAHVSPEDMATTSWGYAETYSVLLRRHNRGDLDAILFADAISLLRAEVIDNQNITLLPITDGMIFAAVSAMRKHNLNATDAAILTMLLGYIQTPHLSDCVVVASDKTLIRAADAEGFKTLNPELLPASDIPAFLASLT